MAKQEHTFVHAKCPECGGQLKFIEGKRKLACTKCKYKRELSNRYDNVVTKKALKDRVNIRDFTRGFGKYPLKEYKCGNSKCKAVVAVKRNAALKQCPFCHGTDLKEGADRQNKNLFPDQLIPPVIPRKAATSKLKRHLGSFFLNLYAPGIKDVLDPENMKGIYLPAFLFDAYTRTKWRGDAGFKYTYTIPDGSGGGNKGGGGGRGKGGRGRGKGGGGGKQQSGTLWESIDGYFEQLYDNFYILGSDAKEKGSESVLVYDIKDTVRFDDRYMGTEWAVELYQKDDITFFEEADSLIDKDLSDQARKKLTSNNKRIEGNKKLEVVSEKSAITFRHIWVPIWIVVFAYQGKHFQFIINAQTGRLHGKRPLSTIRIIIAVAIATLILLIIAILTR